MKVTVIAEGADTLIAQTFQTLIDEKEQAGMKLHSWQMTHERYQDGESSYLIVAVFEET